MCERAQREKRTDRERKGQGDEVYYQFLAMMGLAWRFNFLDLGLCFTLLREDLFFFFWSSRPMLLSALEHAKRNLGRR